MTTFLDSLAKAIGDFGAQLGSSKIGTLTQIWAPEPGEDGCIVLNTQGLPFALNGSADLLALFRCISCKYKFSTDTTKPWLMGPVGRVYTSGEPELTQNVQDYDPTVYIRLAEAQRCQINYCMFLPLYESPQRDSVSAVMEVIQTESSGVFAALVDWARVCLERSGVWTVDLNEKDELPLGLRTIDRAFDASVFESKIEVREVAVTHGNGTSINNITGSLSGAGPPTAPLESMPPPSNALAAAVARSRQLDGVSEGRFDDMGYLGRNRRAVDDDYGVKRKRQRQSSILKETVVQAPMTRGNDGGDKAEGCIVVPGDDDGGDGDDGDGIASLDILVDADLEVSVGNSSGTIDGGGDSGDGDFVGGDGDSGGFVGAGMKFAPVTRIE